MQRGLLVASDATMPMPVHLLPVKAIRRFPSPFWHLERTKNIRAQFSISSPELTTIQDLGKYIRLQGWAITLKIRPTGLPFGSFHLGNRRVPANRPELQGWRCCQPIGHPAMDS